jgi:hypothetical protein
MPVPRRHDELEVVEQARQRLADPVASRNGERPARAEVVLEVDD